MFAINNENPEFLNEFLKYLLTIKNRSKNTIKEYQYDIRLFFKFLEYDKRTEAYNEEQFDNIGIMNVSISSLDSVSFDTIEEYIHFLTDKRNLGISARQRKISSLKTFFNYMESNNLITHNPISKITLRNKKGKQKVHISLTLEEAQLLLKNSFEETLQSYRKATCIRNYCILTLLLNLGLRAFEVSRLNITDIDMDSKELKILRKGNKEQILYLNESCIITLKNYLQIRKEANLYDSNALFVSERGTRISIRTIQYIVQQELLKAGFNNHTYSAHKLRHTAATLTYQYTNATIRDIQKMLGHVSIATTQIYLKSSNKQIEKAFKNSSTNKMLVKGDFIGS